MYVSGIRSGSWDGTLRLWEIQSGRTTRRFVGHAKDVLSVAFSADNRQIVSGSRDKTIKLWNTLGECKYTIQEDVSAVVVVIAVAAARNFIVASLHKWELVLRCSEGLGLLCLCVCPKVVPNAVHVAIECLFCRAQNAGGN